MPDIKIFRMSEYDWFAGESLDQCKKLALQDFGYDEDSFDKPREITEEELDELIFVEDIDDDPPGERKPFRQKLAEMIAEGAEFPDMFASTEV